MSSASARIENAIRFGILVEQDDPDMEELVLSITDEQIVWIAMWLAGEGFDRIEESEPA